MFKRRTKLAAVLGCGPAGLFAAHALKENGWDVSIFSKKRRSEMFGAQYLHKPISGLTTSLHQRLFYETWGTAEGYAQKVYHGVLSADKVSPNYLDQVQDIWDIREAYYNAWRYYASLIVSMYLDSSSIHSLKQGFDLVVSSVPAPLLCRDMDDKHKFTSETIWAVGEAPERGIFSPVEVAPFTVICNGQEQPRWYRASNIFGYSTVEWPGDVKPPVDDIASVEKPISTNCDCHLDKKFIRVGRYGTWTKGVLSHSAYDDVREKIR